MTNDLALKVKNLNVVLEGEEIIRDLTFEMRERETLIILGPNGVEKSTLLRTLRFKNVSHKKILDIFWRSV